MSSPETARQWELLKLARCQLLRQLAEDLRAGQSPYPRLRRAQESLEQDECFGWRMAELSFVEGLFGLLLGASRWDAMERVRDLEAQTMLDRSKRHALAEKPLGISL